ncbi:ATP-binding protein [Staphylococcus aureus]
MGDGQDNYVHLGERDCSVQRKNQKLIEESPCAALTEERRQQICNDAVKVARAANYRSAGTIEFLATDTAHYFIELMLEYKLNILLQRCEQNVIWLQHNCIYWNIIIYLFHKAIFNLMVM